MTTGQILLALAAGFSATLIAFKEMARNKGWPHGSIFHQNTIPSILGLSGLAAVLGRVTIAFTSHGNGWSSLVYAVLGAFVGVALITTILGKQSGPVALVAAPAACIAMFFFA